MHDLTAQVTSSLLPFPGVTIDALGEDEITLDSVLHGKFTVGRSGLAWLACGPHLEVVHSVTGERLSAYCFSGGGEHPPSVLAARDFSWLKRSGLLVGLEEAEGSVLCLYDLALSRVVKAVVIPGRITAIEPLVSYGGASASTQHLHQSLRWFFGIAAVVTDLGHVLLVDLCLDDLSCSQSELEASDLQVVTKSPAEIPRLREVGTSQGRHLCLQLNGPSSVGATALQYISRTNQLAVGFSDGNLQLWNMKTLKKEYHSQLEGGRVPVHAFTFQEPENDPRNCCYLWAVQSSQDLEGDMVSLRLLQLAFSERKCLSSGKILYEGLEYCEERYSQELNGRAFPLRAQATNTRLLSCQTIEKFRHHPDRDDSMNEVASPDTSVSIFCWQVKAYGQGTPSTYIGVFDINRWYHAQMPDSLRTGQSLQNCPYLAVWSLDPVVQMVSKHVLLDVLVHERSLSRGLPFTCPPPEQYFNPTTYNFDVTCLITSGIVHSTCSGYQKETLSFLKKAAPCSSEVISNSYSRCLMSGLLSSRLADTQPSSLSQEEQLDAILSTAVETSSLGMITGCIKQWTAEEQPGSALNLRYILDWAWNKVVQTKKDLDGICAPLFDSSSNFTDPQTMQLLQHSQRLLSNLSTIFHCLLSEAQELTQKGLVGLINKNLVSSLISKYAQVVLWFCRTGLLPEGSEDDALQISRPFYTHSVISNYYTIRREELTKLSKGKWCADCLMIDGLVGQCGERLINLWKRDENGTGQYPPPTLHALLDIYLLDNIDEATKHAIVIYLLLDVLYSFPNKEGASVESFPPAFAIPIGLVKLVQGLWLLDHHDHQSSFELLLHPAASQCQFEWQHERVLHALMCQSQHAVALRYFHVTKPPVSSTSQAKLYLSVLIHNKCLIEAWSLLRRHSNRLNMEELLAFLYESCQELGLIPELFKLPLSVTEQEGLEKFLQGTGGLQNRELLMVHYLQQANYIPALQLNQRLKVNFANERDPKLKERSITRNSILDQYGKVLPRVQRKMAMEKGKPYQHPNAIHREISRPQPLSTITRRSVSEKVMSRAGFINNVLSKIEEVWLGKGASPQSSPGRSPRAADAHSPKPSSSSMALSEPFLGTPITMTSRRKSRLKDLVVHPSCTTPRPLLSPPGPLSSWVSPKSICKAPELSLLQTPQVVKRARALAASGPVFSAFTPQSILRSSLRPTPVATPSASPGRSITPPLRNKESRITFIDEEETPVSVKGIRWTNGVAADSEISLLTRDPILSKATQGGLPSPELRCFDSESISIHESAAETRPSDATHTKLNLSFDTSQKSDTTLEFYDAQDQEREEGQTAEEDEVVTVNIKNPTENEEAEERLSQTIEQTPVLTSEDTAREEENEDETFEDVMEIGLEEEAKHVEEVQSKEEDEQEVTEGTDSGAEVESPDLPVEQDVQTEASESTEFTDALKPSAAPEPTITPEEELESSDLTAFVQRHLFGGDPSPPLSRSGIHDASQMQASFNSESAGEADEEVQDAAEAPPVFTSQKSSASVTSTEQTGTDSQSVVSLNDIFVQQEHTHFLPSLSEQEAAQFSLIEPGAEIKMLEENMEGEVVMVRLGADEELDAVEDEEQGTSYMELKPSTTLLVPLELVEGQGLVDGSQMCLPGLQQTLVPDEQRTEANGSFSLMLDMDDDADTLPMENDLQCSDPPSLSPAVEALDKPEVIILDTDDQDPPGSGEISEKDQSKEMDTLDGIELDGTTESELAGLQTENTAENLETEDAKVQSDEEVVMLVEDHETAGLSMSEPDPVGESSAEMLVEDQEQEGRSVSGPSPVGELPAQMLAEDNEPESLSDSGPIPVEEPTAGILAAEDQEPEVISLSEPSPVEEPTAEILAAEDQEPEVISLSEPSPVEEPTAEILAAEDQEPEVISLSEPSPVEEPTAEILAAEDQEPEVISLSEPSPVEEPTADMPAEEDQEPEVLSLSEPSPVEEPTADMPAEEDQEPEVLSLSEPSPVEEPTAEMLGEEDQGPEVISLSEPSPVEEPLAEMPAKEDQEPESLSDSEPNALEVIPPVVDDKDSMAEQDANREMGEEKEEPAPAGVVISNSQPEEQPVLEAPYSQRKKKAPSTPTRRTTRGRTIAFTVPLQEEAEEELTSTLFPASPSRKSNQSKVQFTTPRRSSRNAKPEPPKEDVKEEIAMDTDNTTTSPARRRVSQKATSIRNSKKTESGDDDEEEEIEGVTDTKVYRRTSSKTQTPAKRRTTRVNTPTRSSRRILSSSEVESATLEILEEQKEPVEVFATPAKRNSRKSKTTSSETATRQSNRITLSVYPQSSRKTIRETITDNIKESGDLLEPEVNSKTSRSNARRSTRTKLWDYPEEDHPLLDSPLEVHSETPVADALIKRLQDEREKQEVVTKMVKTSKRSTKSSVEEVHFILPVNPSLIPELEEEESNPGENSYIYSPSRRRTRAKRGQSPSPSEESAARVTRSRRKVVKEAPQDEIASEEDLGEMEKAASVSKTRKSGKRTAKSKAVLERPPIAEVELLSPLPSPADPLPRTQKRTKEGEPPAPSRNLRRKRIMETAFSKPVTRRKKL
ncbi:hypothetical protein JOQ06_009381 [Pogonophryne albipinna]|uniref:Protein ELYS n=1 Tax=Pogonophryne albipinna TaxID=1090488 RepID=A0AAD6BN72_9TELE|nr:hypothetical protein JOQ06_009381 [Pogonophryne albipinna]